MERSEGLPTVANRPTEPCMQGSASWSTSHDCHEWTIISSYSLRADLAWWVSWGTTESLVSVVSVAVVNHTRTSPDSDKGNGTWLCGMGPHLGRTQDSVAMRQPGSGRVSRVQNQ